MIAHGMKREMIWRSSSEHVFVDRAVGTTSFRKTHALLLLLLGLGNAMTVNSTDSTASSSIQMRCTVTSVREGSAVEFEAGFCRVLADQLTRNLTAQFRLVDGESWPADGKALSVAVRAETHTRADVTIATGMVAQGTFVPESKITTTVETVDSDLRPGASVALVRIIGVQMGLIR